MAFHMKMSCVYFGAQTKYWGMGLIEQETKNGTLGTTSLMY